MNLIKKKLLFPLGEELFSYDDVKEAILEDLDDLDNLINVINNQKITNLNSLNEIFEVHKKLKLLRFGDFKNE